jgi:hypothetical protein
LNFIDTETGMLNVDHVVAVRKADDKRAWLVMFTRTPLRVKPRLRWGYLARGKLEIPIHAIPIP